MQELLLPTFLSDKDYPFSLQEWHQFFGYSNKGNLLKFINRHFKNYELDIEYLLIDKRKRFEYYFCRDLFIDLAKLKKKDLKPIATAYAKYLAKPMQVFKRLKRGDCIPSTYIKKAGLFFTYILRSDIIARKLQLDPYDFYKFINKEFSFKRFEANRSICFHTGVPYYSFMSKVHQDRYLVIVVLKQYLRTQKLSDWKKALLPLYIKELEAMLMKQFEIDCKKKKKQPPKHTKNANCKLFYKEAVKKLHPDSTTDPHKKQVLHQYFIQLNDAYQNNDYYMMKRIVTAATS